MALNDWRLADFRNLDYSQTMRLVIPVSMLMTIGFQGFFSVFASILGIKRK